MSKVVTPTYESIACSCSNGFGNYSVLFYRLTFYRRSAVCVERNCVERSAAKSNGITCNVVAVCYEYIENIIAYNDIGFFACNFITTLFIGANVEPCAVGNGKLITEIVIGNGVCNFKIARFTRLIDIEYGRLQFNLQRFNRYIIANGAFFVFVESMFRAVFFYVMPASCRMPMFRFALRPFFGIGMDMPVVRTSG